MSTGIERIGFCFFYPTRKKIAVTKLLFSLYTLYRTKYKIFLTCGQQDTTKTKNKIIKADQAINKICLPLKKKRDRKKGLENRSEKKNT